MNAHDLKKKLESIIESKLSPLIDNDYVYWDLPYHINIGDTLIWQGTLDFLENKPYKMLDFGSFLTSNLSQLNQDTIILLHGGGNFGDIYFAHQKFRKSVIEKYPNNKIIILPQTIYYENKIVEEHDFQFFSQHSNLYLCVRDQASYDLAIKYLEEEKVLLLPDMAFCIKDQIFVKTMSTGNELLMSRIDVEATLVNQKYIDQVDLQSDWPTFEKSPIYYKFLRVLLSLNKKIFKDNNQTFLVDYANSYAMNYMRKKLINTGINFINGFDIIYTTRLHGCILSLLLDKKIILLDNSYGKNRAYYDAWLQESSNIEIGIF